MKITWCLEFVLAAQFIVGCAATYQQLEPGRLYKRDAKIEISGKAYEGVVVVPRQSQYEFLVTPKGGIDLLILRTCHREYVAEKVDPGFMGIGGGQFKYSYKPVIGLEDTRVCPLRVDFFESSKEGRHSWAFVDFEHPEYTVNGRLTCNGAITPFHGVAACQNKVGLIQRLDFLEPVQFAPPKPDSCNMPRKVNSSYELEVSLGECLYHFRTRDNRIGRFTMIGYEGILVREGQ
jgi:hypothetical protein